MFEEIYNSVEDIVDTMDDSNFTPKAGVMLFFDKPLPSDLDELYKILKTARVFYQPIILDG